MDASTCVALITGGTRGIGLGIAQALAKEKIKLVLWGRRPLESVEPILQELRCFTDVLYQSCDVSNLEEQEDRLNSICQQWGNIHILVNNAGMAPKVRADILDASPESFDEIIATNLRGPYFLTQKVARRMVASRQAGDTNRYVIVNISSISAYTASVNRGDYCISKSGIAMMTKLFAARLAEYDIPVYEVRPGIVKTDMTLAVQEKYGRLIQNGLTPIRRWVMPHDVGQAVLACVKGMIPMSTGQVIDVDGGFHLRIL